MSLEDIEYGLGPIKVGASATAEGVGLHVEHPDTGEVLRVFTVAPEFARDIARNLTLRSFECEELRKEGKI